MQEYILNELEKLKQNYIKLNKMVNDMLCNIDESNFSDEYINKIRNLGKNIGDVDLRLNELSYAKIGTARIDDVAITNAKIEDLSVTTVKIEDSAITNSKIQDASITSAKIGLAQIKSANIEDSAISNAKIQNMSVDNAKIATGAIDNAKLGIACVETANIKDSSITSAKIASLAVQTANIALGAITKALIDNEAVGTAQIANASITDAKIVELTANKITAGTLEVVRLIVTGFGSIVEAINKENSTPQLSISTVDGAALTDRTITADKIVAKAITANEMASKTITANEIMVNAITGDEITADSILARHIKANEITLDKLNANIGNSLDISSNQAIINKVEDTVLQEAQNAIQEQNKSTIRQTASEIMQSIDIVNAGLNELDSKLSNSINSLSLWQRFNQNGMDMGRSDSPFIMRLSNQKLAFLQNEIELAYFANNKMYVDKAEIANELNMGKPSDFYAIKADDIGFGIIYGGNNIE